MNTHKAKVLLREIKECAVEAGVYDRWFIAFGTLLGAVRPSLRKVPRPHYMRGIIEHDDDMDIGLLSDKISIEEEKRYISLLRERGFFAFRSYEEHHQIRSDTNKHVWFSLRKEAANKEGVKCCHWGFWEFNGFHWHSKGTNWLSENKFPSIKYPHTKEDHAMAKGMPAHFIDDGLLEVDFEGDRYNVPKSFGHCLDYWYPCFAVPRVGGASAAEFVMKVGDWKDKSTWQIF